MSRAMHTRRPTTAPPDRSSQPPAGEPTLIRTLDLQEPVPDLPGGEWGRVWLLVRLGERAIGELLLRVPNEGLTSGAVGAAVAAQFGVTPLRAAKRAPDAQPRSRNRGRTRSA